MSKNTVTRVIFWLAFAMFLGVSIPHVAWIYHIYEPNDLPVWWILSYGIAVSIDALVCWLSYVQSTGSIKDKGITWSFIVALAGLSWYANYLYSIAHDPNFHGDVWNIVVPFTGVTTGTLTPIIVSAIPIFILGYTYMLGKVGNAQHETLEEKATRLENEKAAKLRIQAVNQGKLTDRLKAAISSVADVASHAKTELLSGSNQDPTPDTPETLNGYNQDPLPETIKTQLGSNQDPTPDTPETQSGSNQDPLLDRLLTQSGYNTDRVTDALEIELGSSNGYKADTHQDRETDKETETSKPGTTSSNRSNGSLYISLADVSMMHGYSVEYLKKLVNAGTIATKKNDKTMLLVSSVNRYVSSHGRKKSDTLEIPALRIVGD